jgi:hypothetical protein
MQRYAPDDGLFATQRMQNLLLKPKRAWLNARPYQP